MAAGAAGWGQAAGSTMSGIGSIIGAVSSQRAAATAAGSASRAADKIRKFSIEGRDLMANWVISARSHVENLTEPVKEILDALVEDGLIDIKAGTDLADAILGEAQKQSEEWIDKATTDASAEIDRAEERAGRALTDSEMMAIFQTKTAETRAAGAIGDALQRSVEYLTPYMEAGKKGLSLFDTIESDVKLSPLFKLQQAEGEKAIDRAFAKRGLRGSGANIKALKDFNEELTATETERQYQRIFERGQTLAGYGLAATQLGVGAETAAGKSLADVYYGTGGRLAGIATGAGTARAGLAERAGAERAGVKERSGKYKAGLASIYGPARADLARTGKQQELALKQGAGQTYLDFLTNQATYIAGLEERMGQNVASITAGAGAQMAPYSTAAGLIRGASIADIGAMTAKGVSSLGQYASSLFQNTGTQAPAQTTVVTPEPQEWEYPYTEYGEV